jgi:ATP-dependent DNA ligase
LDGEYYLHGYPLQELSSAIRNESQNELKDKMIYHIFDIVITDKDVNIQKDLCEARLWKIKLLRDAFTLPNINFVESRKPVNPESLKQDYLLKRQQGYEGLIIRVLGKPYESGKTTNMIKLKGSFREEFRIVGFKEGKGKHQGLIIFRCRITEDTIAKAVEYMNEREIPVTEVNIENPIDTEFNVSPALPDSERKKMLEEGESYIGKLYTVEFQDWSKLLKPMRPKGIAIYQP